MYNEIKSGAACNTLVMEHVLRKNPRGDAEIDTEETPFLRDNLRGDKLPSLAERKRRRQRRLAASNPSATGMEPSMSSTKLDAAAVAHDAATVTDHDPELPKRVGGGEEGNLTEQRFNPDREKRSQAGGAGGSKCPNGRYSDHRGERQDKRLPRRPDFKEPIGGSRLAESGGSSCEGHNPNEEQSQSRSRDRAGDTESVPTTHVTDSHRGRHRGRPRQEEPGSRPLNGEDGQGFAGKSIGERRRRRAEEMTDSSSHGDRVSTLSPRIAGEVGGRRRQQITTSASLKTLSLRDMEEREDGSTSKGKVDDALDRWVGNGKEIRRTMGNSAHFLPGPHLRAP